MKFEPKPQVIKVRASVTKPTPEGILRAKEILRRREQKK